MTSRVFRMDLEAWLALTTEQLDGLTRQVCQEAAYRVVVDTPVDTGFLRGSWQPSIGEGLVKDNAVPDPQGAAVLSEVGLVAMGVKAGDTFSMINNAEYGPHVHNGTATMAGRPWVLKVAKSWQSIVETVATQLGLKVK